MPYMAVGAVIPSSVKQSVHPQYLDVQTVDSIDSLLVAFALGLSSCCSTQSVRKIESIARAAVSMFTLGLGPFKFIDIHKIQDET